MTRDHLHDGCPVDDPMGHGVDTALLSHLIGAAFDSCKACQPDLLAAVADHPPTAARTVELACLAVAATAGGLPSHLTDPDMPNARASRAFRMLARTGLDSGNERMFEHAEAMTITERAAAVDSALDLLCSAVTEVANSTTARLAETLGIPWPPDAQGPTAA